jgi:hypothetical protein
MALTNDESKTVQDILIIEAGKVARRASRDLLSRSSYGDNAIRAVEALLNSLEQSKNLLDIAKRI